MPFLITFLLARNRLLSRVFANGVSRTYSSSSSSSCNVVDEEEEMKRVVRRKRMVASLSKLLLAMVSLMWKCRDLVMRYL